MAIAGLNHFNIIASPALIAEVRAFYLDVIGLTEGWRPDFDFDGHWLYAGDAPILHLMSDPDLQTGDTGETSKSTGHLDHIALTASGLADMEARLRELNIDYDKKEVPGFNITQLFIRDPIGLGVELNFMAS